MFVGFIHFFRRRCRRLHVDASYFFSTTTQGIRLRRLVDVFFDDVVHQSKLFQVRGHRILFDHTFNVYKACFAWFGSLSYTTNAIHSVHQVTHTLSCSWLILLSQSRLQQSDAASFPLRNSREPFVAKSSGQNCTLFRIKKSNIASKCPILHIRFSKFPNLTHTL